jgi:CubicO group peptidase (beta-lactamase class C family)
MRSKHFVTVMGALCFSIALGNVSGEKRETESKESPTDQIFRSLADAQSPGFAVLVRKNGRTLFSRGYGVRELRTRAAIDPQTNFRLASCTKQFTAMAVMLLVHDGKLRYDERLTEVFPKFPEYGREITIRSLLNHTSGLPDYEELMERDSAGRSPRWTEVRQIRDGEVLTLLEAEKRGKFAPGTRWAYSNSGYVVLGLVAAKVSGKPFEDFLRERIFEPLQMSDTVAYVRGKNEVRERAYGHEREGSGFRESDQSSTSATLGDGGVYSNLEDLAKWDDALARNTLLSAAEMRPALTAVKLADGSLPGWASGPGDTDPMGGRRVEYGFGWFLNPYGKHSRMWHFGDTVGFKTAVERFSEEGLTMVVLANRSDVDSAELAERVADLYLGGR